MANLVKVKLGAEILVTMAVGIAILTVTDVAHALLILILQENLPVLLPSGDLHQRAHLRNLLSLPMRISVN